MRKLLREHYKELLKEEIDFSSKTATVYHLTGFKTARYDPVYAKKIKKTNKDLAGDIDKKYANKKKSRTQSILANAEYQIASKELKNFKTPQGQAYYIADNIRKGAWDAGSFYIPGGGKLYGEGLYTCYNLNPKIARTYGSVILRFEADISTMLIFNAGIAKGIYGEKFRLEDQFLQICKKRNVDIEGFYNQEVSIDISPDSSSSIGDFLEILTQMSDRPAFLNSDFGSELRTAPLALQVITSFSKLFKNGRYAMLRDVIDGVIFFGDGDGPVCLVYHPEITLRYKLTGAGYFDKKGNPVIESEIERLIGRSGTSLLDTFEFSQEIDEDQREIDAARAEKFREKLANFSKEPNTDEEFLKSIPKRIDDIMMPVTSLYESAAEDIILSRVESSQPGFDDYCYNVAKGYKYVQLICSILAEPFLNFVEIFGPGLEIVSKEEFEKYCYIFKQYAFTSHEYPPTLADFELNGLKCVAKNDEEFKSLVGQNLQTLTEHFKKMFDEGLAEEYIKVITADAILAGGECFINNSVARFELGEIDLNTSNDAESLKTSLLNSGGIVKDAEQKLLDIFNDKRVQTPDGRAILESMFKNSQTLSIENGIDFTGVAKNFGYYSNFCQAGGDIFYNLCEQIRSLDFGNLSSHAIDKATFDPEFILQRMYGLKSDYDLKDGVGLSLSMFRDGRKLFNDTSSLVTLEFVKSKVIGDKVSNLSWVVEDMFTLPIHREEILI